LYNAGNIIIGNLALGGKERIVLQSMTNTPTHDVTATVEQCIRIIESGGQMVRITVPTMKEVENLREIKKQLVKRGYNHPLVADVHFRPEVAVACAEFVEKVRINPGNYVPSMYKGSLVYNDEDYAQQLEIIRERLLPLITACKKHHTSIRIGVNHGSLSSRILNWYGNTPEGMVNSALEFLKVFSEEDFFNIVVSLKASSTRVMIHANRLMVCKMNELGLCFPLHLGVTEAGDEDDGRIRSAVGIGTLLKEGIGDTVRVSLTEEPEKEIPVAAMIRELSGARKPLSEMITNSGVFPDLFSYNPAIKRQCSKIGGNTVPVVILSLGEENSDFDYTRQLGYSKEENDEFKPGLLSPDYLFSSTAKFPDRISSLTGKISSVHKGLPAEGKFFPLFFSEDEHSSGGLHFITIDSDIHSETLKELNKRKNAVLVFDAKGEDLCSAARQLAIRLKESGNDLPFILHQKYSSKDRTELMIKASIDFGSLIVDGIANGIWIEEENSRIDLSEVRKISFGILQACAARISDTEYISCPSCGRTLFDIQKVLKQVKEATAGFAGIKIAVMGCIVNGPGEMADADYGYVGSGPGKVSLYMGKVPVRKNIPEREALGELLKLIEDNQTN